MAKDDLLPGNDETMYKDSGSNPARMCSAVTPSDTVDLTTWARGLYVGTGGDVKIHNIRGEAVTFANVPDGSFLPVWTRRVFAIGTDATDIVALFG
jgi:hypothetical protein